MNQKNIKISNVQDKEKRFTLLLVVLLVLFLVQPFFSGNEKLLTFLSDLVFSIVVGTTAYALSIHRQYMIFALLLGLPAIILRWLYWIYLEKYLWVASYLLGISILLFCSYELLSFILQVKKVSQHTINAAICIYLSLGVAWGMAYLVLETLAPGSFTLAELVNEPQALIMDMLYYSIVTLTTLGYGDITPVTPWAKNLSALEAVIGQVYLTVLVARLVSLNTTQVNQDKE
ncbi:MAG: two pore domain potassium channel family protein [Methyloprofundus sp.]|nr:two pore domain potassium channel family protein [Methyloprofundus sp.]